MKTASDIALDFFMDLDDLRWSSVDVEKLEKIIIADRKEQDKITRHACAYEVTRCVLVNEDKLGNRAISPDEAHNRCMNVKAV